MINNNLRQYKEIDELMDIWLVLAVEDIQVVYQWRLQAEQESRMKGKAAMTDEQVNDFVSRFFPAYRAYLSNLYLNGPRRRRRIEGIIEGEEAVPVLKIVVDSNRLPINRINSRL